MPKLRVDEHGFPIRHKKILKLTEEGKTPKEIATMLKMDYKWVHKILKTPAFMAATNSIYEDAISVARSLFEKHAVDAATKIIKISQYGKPESRLQFDAAKEILYQVGLKPVDVVETRGRDYTPEELKSSLITIKEIKAIEEKLSTHGSGFLVQTNTQDADASSVAPVNADKVANELIEEPQVV